MRRGNMRPFDRASWLPRTYGVKSVEARVAGCCRVCHRSVEPGDHVLVRSMHSEMACITCGFFRLDDLLGPDADQRAFRAAVETNRLDEWKSRCLAAMGLIRLAPNNAFGWTVVGRKLREEYKNRRAA